jgi:hypothetical protein
MNQEAAYALLAADSYRDARRVARNYAPIPLGWTELKDYAISGSGEGATLSGAGFSARVYRGPSGEIVISYAGTQFGGSGVGQTGDWGSGNAPLALGFYGQQAMAAAELYQKVRSELGSNIFFTGHNTPANGLKGYQTSAACLTFRCMPLKPITTSGML